MPAITTDVSYPAAYPESIAVGAVTDFGCRANYSQYGSALAFVAPSNGGNSGITTTDRTGSAGYDTDRQLHVDLRRHLVCDAAVLGHRRTPAFAATRA